MTSYGSAPLDRPTTPKNGVWTTTNTSNTPSLNSQPSNKNCTTPASMEAGMKLHTKTAQPASQKPPRSQTKVLYFGSADDVNKWLRKHCGQYHQLYGPLFRYHEITGRTLARMTECKLQTMGIASVQHREDIMRHIMRLKLKTEVKELKGLDQKALTVVKKSN